ncbi:SMR family transporter [Crenobacter sp. SG2305]|nr:SMR family transporter [Crenobacter sp. SG2305]MDN0083483.1 SMR family transporter [Crenobacter sp. SG2305]
MMYSWIALVVAGLLEVCWAIGLKESQGFTRLWPSVFTAVTLSTSFLLLSWALKQLPVGTGYAVWVGIGACGTAIIGMVWLGEAVTLLRVGSLMAIAAGIVGLKLAG